MCPRIILIRFSASFFWGQNRLFKTLVKIMRLGEIFSLTSLNGGIIISILKIYLKYINENELIIRQNNGCCSFTI